MKAQFSSGSRYTLHGQSTGQVRYSKKNWQELEPAIWCGVPSFCLSVCMWQVLVTDGRELAKSSHDSTAPANSLRWVQSRALSWKLKAEQSIRVNFEGITETVLWTWTIQGKREEERVWYISELMWEPSWLWLKKHISPMLPTQTTGSYLQLLFPSDRAHLIPTSALRPFVLFLLPPSLVWFMLLMMAGLSFQH